MAFFDRMIAGIGPSSTLAGVPLRGGTPFPNNNGRGGVRYGSHASVTRAMVGAPSQHFVDNVSCIVPWHWWGRAAGDNSTNSCGEMKRACAQILDARDNQWKWLYKDARPAYGTAYTNGRGGSTFAPNIQLLADGTARVTPQWNETWEVWPLETTGVPYPAKTFWGGVNRDLVSNMRALCVAVLARKALINPGGTNDLANARFGLQLGTDPHVAYQTGLRYIVWASPFVLTDTEGAGYPYKAYDGDFSAWELVTEEWEWYGFITGHGIPGQVTRNVGPIWGDWTWIPEWFEPPYQIPWSELQYLPPMDPDSGTTPAPTPAPTPVPAPAPALILVDASYRQKSVSGNDYASEFVVPPEGTGVNSVSVTPTSVTFTALAQTQQLTPTVDVDSGISTAVSYSVTGSAATVTSGGLIDAVAEGTAVVKVESDVDSSKYALVNVTVTIAAPPAPSQLLELTRLPMRTRGYKG